MEENRIEFIGFDCLGKENTSQIRNDIINDANIGLAELGLFAVMCSISNTENEVTLTEILDVSRESKEVVLKTLGQLLDNGYIKQYNIGTEPIKDLVIKNKNKGLECEWCGTKTISIQGHHYPIPKSLGGTKIVNICANCHYEFHHFYRKTDIQFHDKGGVYIVEQPKKN